MKALAVQKGAKYQVASNLAVDAHGMPVKFVLSEGGVADRLFTEALIADTTADKLFADEAYDTIRNLAVSLGMDAVMLPKANCKKQLAFDRYCHLMENRFLDFKR